MAVIGIDLGTTNSLGAVYRNGKVELIPNHFGSFLTPSVVNIDEKGMVTVGQIAKERLVTHPESTVASFKKEMGSEKKWRLSGKEYSPEELSSLVIRSIVTDAEAYLNEKVEEAVISVPAYFHDKQRVATKRAGALAGVRVERIINEPSAAALASYFDTSSEQLFLIFDFGGGTLDVSIVECFDTMVEILSVSGDNRLGGDNFHEVMAEKFMEEHRLEREQVSAQEYAVLLRQAESCKRKLSEQETAYMTATVGGREYRSLYTNERMMEDCAGILGRIKKVLAHALRDGGLSLRDIDAVVMVGGSSKMPLIQSYLQHLFGQIPLVTGNCDEMIARGVGLVCAVKERQEEVKDYVLTDICPFTLGTDIVNEVDPNHSYMSPIVERNTVLPCSRVQRFYTSHDYQTKINMQILQGEHTYAEDNLKLGTLRVMVPGKTKGKESVDVRFTYDINGILLVDATVVSTGKTISKVFSQNISEEEVARRSAELEKLKVHPKDMEENCLVMERLQALYEEMPPDVRTYMQEMIRRFEYLLAKQNPRPIKKYREYLLGVMEQLESYDPFAPPVFADYEDEDEDDWVNEDEEQETEESDGGEWMNEDDWGEDDLDEEDRDDESNRKRKEDTDGGGVKWTS